MSASASERDDPGFSPSGDLPTPEEPRNSVDVPGAGEARGSGGGSAGGARRRLTVFSDHWPRAAVTMALIAACVGVDLVTRVEGSIGSYLMFVPKLAEQEPYRFLASAFVHASFWHLLLNMYVLWVFGSVLEPAIGHTRFLGIYLLSAVAGNAAVILTADPLGNSWFSATVGASGAVFGLLGAQLVVARVSGADLTGLAVFIALNAVISLSPDSGISWQSHAGGFVAGAATMYAFSRARVLSPEKRRIVDAVVFAALSEALAVVVAVWGYS